MFLRSVYIAKCVGEVYSLPSLLRFIYIGKYAFDVQYE